MTLASSVAVLLCAWGLHFATMPSSVAGQLASCDGFEGPTACAAAAAALLGDCCFDWALEACVDSLGCSCELDYVLDDCFCFGTQQTCATAAVIFDRACEWSYANKTIANATCIESVSNQDVSIDHCGYVTVEALQRAVPLDACMKLSMAEPIYTLYTCYNGSVYQETFSAMDCKDSSLSTRQQITDETYDYQCGLGGNCNYTAEHTFDRCDGEYSVEDEFTNYTLIYTVVGNEVWTSGDVYYYADCSTFFIYSPNPTSPPTVNTGTPTTTAPRRRNLLQLNTTLPPTLQPTTMEPTFTTSSPTFTTSSPTLPTIDPNCNADDQRAITSQCVYQSHIRSVSCGYVQLEPSVDDDVGFMFPTAYALNECHVHSYVQPAAYASFQFECDDGKIYQNLFTSSDCSSDTMITRKYMNYAFASCADATFCDTATVQFTACDDSAAFASTLVADVCLQIPQASPSNIVEAGSWLLKCTDHSIVWYEYDFPLCDDGGLIGRYEFNADTCVANGTSDFVGFGNFSVDVINCTAPKCPLIEPYADSYALCNIFHDTNIHRAVPWWNTDYNNYCEWTRTWERGASNIAPSDAFQCFIVYVSHLDLANYSELINGSLDTIGYAWPTDLRYLNLHGLGLSGVWDWSALQEAAFSMHLGLDIGGNNFSGPLEMRYIVGTALAQIDISHNALMSGYLDWQALAITTELDGGVLKFHADGISWDGFADFSMFADLHSLDIRLDVAYQCHPYKYICIANDTYSDDNDVDAANEFGFMTADRSNVSCGSKYECEDTCECADGAWMFPTGFDRAPVIDIINCDRSIQREYNLTAESGIPFDLGDWSHYYLAAIPDSYDDVNFSLTFAVESNFAVILEVYGDVEFPMGSWEVIGASDGATGESFNETEVTVNVTGGRFYYVRVVDYWSVFYHETPLTPPPNLTPQPQRRRRRMQEAEQSYAPDWCFVPPYVTLFGDGETYYDYYDGGGLTRRRRNLLQGDVPCGSNCSACDSVQINCESALEGNCFWLSDSALCRVSNTCESDCTLCDNIGDCQTFGAGGAGAEICQWWEPTQTCVGLSCNSNCDVCSISECGTSSAPPNGCAWLTPIDSSEYCSQAPGETPSPTTVDEFLNATFLNESQCNEVFSRNLAAGERAVYKFVPSSQYTIYFDGCQSSFDTVFEIYNSSDINGDYIAYNDDSDCGLPSYLDLPYDPAYDGQSSYYFVAKGFSSSGSGMLVLTFGCAGTPPPTLPPVALSCDFGGWQYTLSMTGCTQSPTPQPTKNPTEFEVTGEGAVASQSPRDGDVIGDAFNRFVSSIELYVRQDFELSPSCFDCFQWFLSEANTNAADASSSLNDLYGTQSEILTFYNLKTGEYVNAQGDVYDVVQSFVVIRSIRTAHSGWCLDESSSAQHPLIPGNYYEIQLRVQSDNATPIFSSAPIAVSTAEAPKDGYCEVFDLENAVVLTPFSLQCYSWTATASASSVSNFSFSYNALFADVAMMESFQSSPLDVIGYVGVGDFEIVALVQDDDFASVACYEMSVEFPSIEEMLNQSNTTVDELWSDIEELIDTVRLGESNDIGVAIYSVVDGLYRSNLTDRQRSAQGVQALVENLVASSPLLDSVNETNASLPVSAAEIISELTTFVRFTSNPEIVNDDVVDTLVDDYMPVILYEVFKAFIASDDDDDDDNGNETMETDFDIDVGIDISNDLYAMTTQFQRMVDQLEHTVVETYKTQWSDFGRRRVNTIAENMTEFALFAAHTAVAQSLPGESYTYIHESRSGSSNYTKIVSALKFESNEFNRNVSVECGYGADNVRLPAVFKSRHRGIFDCTFSKSTNSLYDSSVANQTVNASDLVSVNVYEDYGGNISAIQLDTTQCDPYLITITATDRNVLTNDGQLAYDFNSLDGTAGDVIFPQCNFWDGSSHAWDNIDCWVHNFTSDGETVICGCLHLTAFTLSKEDVAIQANTIGKWEWRAFTAEHLVQFPLVWITQLILFGLALVVCLCNPREHGNPSLLAYEDIIFEKVKDEKLKHDVTGFEMNYIAKYLPNPQYLGEGLRRISRGGDAKKSLCQMQVYLFLLYLRNDHTVLSVFQRTEGTNLSSKTRIALLFVYLCTVMFATAIFYGQQQNSWFGDIAASFLISIIGTLPVFITKKILINTKPAMVPRTLQIAEFKEIEQAILDTQREGEDEEEEPDNVENGNGGDGDVMDDDESQKIKQRASSKHHRRKSSTLVTTKEYRASVDIIFSKQMNAPQSTLRSALGEVRKSKSKAAHVKLANDVRITLFNTIYPLSPRFRMCAWTFLVLWTLFVVIMSLNYGIQFDLEYTEEQNAENDHLDAFEGDCWWNNKLLVLEDILSARSLQELQDSLRTHHAGDYVLAESESAKWLFSLVQSLCLSVFLWQPLTVYVITWLKIWMFSWNLRMKPSPVNICKLFKRACRCSKAPELPKEFSFVRDGVGDKKHAHSFYVIAHQSRPLDIIGYFSNDELFLKYDDQTRTLVSMFSVDVALAEQDEGDMDDDDDSERGPELATANERKKSGAMAVDAGEVAANEPEMGTDLEMAIMMKGKRQRSGSAGHKYAAIEAKQQRKPRNDKAGQKYTALDTPINSTPVVGNSPIGDINT